MRLGIKGRVRPAGRFELSFALVNRGLMENYCSVGKERLYRYIDLFDFLGDRTMDDGKPVVTATKSAVCPGPVTRIAGPESR